MKKLLLSGIAALLLATGAAHAGKGDFVCSKIVGHSNTGGVDRSTLTISGIGTSIGEDFERERTSFRLENVATAIAF